MNHGKAYKRGQIMGVIATFGDRVADIFWATDRERKRLADDTFGFVEKAADRIIEIMQGENVMDAETNKNKARRLVLEAMNLVRENANRTADWADVANDYADEIIEIFEAEKKDSDFVSKYYEMNPEEDDLLDNGTLVVDDMKVLIASPAFRATIKDDMSEEQIYSARRKNRWATVTNSRVSKVSHEAVLVFVAVYEDGTKRKVIERADTAWLVKKDSIPKVEGLQTEYEVFNKEGTCVFKGTIPEVLTWAKKLPETGGKYTNFVVDLVGRYTNTSLTKFVRQHTKDAE